jgi:hypothetical protein
MAGEGTWSLYYPSTGELQFAEGMLWGVALVIPFWIAVGYCVSLIAG